MTGPVCNCPSQCGCQLGVRCYDCGSPVMPPTGEGYCYRVRFARKVAKDSSPKGEGRCCLPGCQRNRYVNKDYCSRTCAKKDSAI